MTPHDRTMLFLVELVRQAERAGQRGVARQLAMVVFAEKRRVCGVTP